MNICKRHNRYDCWHDECRMARKSDNAGDVSIGVNTGDLNIGIGGGLTIDTATGDLGVEIAPGLSVDF